MADPISASITIAATAVKTVKLIHNLRSAIKDAPADVNDFFDFVHGIGNALSGIHDTLQSRVGHLPTLPSEQKHHADINRVLKNCKRDLERLQKELPKFVKSHNEEVAKKRKGNILRKAVGRSGGERKGNASVAWGMYMRDDPRIRFRLERNLKVLHWSMTTIAFAESWEDRRSRDTILQEVRNLLRALHASNPLLQGTSSIVGSTLVPDDTSTPETEEDKIDTADIKAWTESCFSHTTAVSTQDLPLASSRVVLSDSSKLTSNTLAPTRSHSPGPSHNEVKFMYQENQAIVSRLSRLGLHLNASIYQRKGISIRERIERDFGEPFTSHENALMHEHLVDILLACELPDCTDEALFILQGVHEEGASGEDGKDVLAEDLRCRIELKLGKLHLDLEHSSDARYHLRTAYTGYLVREARVEYLRILREIVELVSKTYALEGNHDEARAWQNKARGDLGGDFESPSRAREMALQWCRANGFDVPADGQVTTSQHFLFDHLRLPQSGSTPLHVAAADPKTKPSVLQEMLKHVDDADTVDNVGDTPLLVAVGRSNMVAVRLLLEHSAVGAHARDRSEQTVLHRCQDAEIASILLEKIARGGSTAVNSLPIPNPGHSSRRRSSAVPPHSSSPPRDPTLDPPSPGLFSPPLPVEQINLDSTDCYGRSALHYAAKSGNLAMINILLNPVSSVNTSLFPGPPPGADPNLLSTGDGTPLVWSITQGRASKADKRAVIRRLIDAGTDPKLRNGQGQDAFDALKRLRFSREESNRLLLPGGASPRNGAPGFEHRRSSHSYSLRPVSTRGSSIATASSGGSAAVFPETPRSSSVSAVAVKVDSNGHGGGAPRLDELTFGDTSFGLGIGMQFGKGKNVIREEDRRH